ncbi:DUF2264 domain-containing protein [Aspergillus stella-maris]|uniref:DUF2264 domain-containing protein n=1 Tax=Aspergillus stella-maris TaxID=1810926 RepID=UPI003CCCB786
MAPLAGFTDNPFDSRTGLFEAATAIVSALHRYKSMNGAKIRVPVATAAGFDETSAQIEGFARPLWVVAFLLQDDGEGEVTAELRTWINGLQAGTDPDSPEYWGDLGDFDQRMVEMESIAIALLATPDTFLGRMDSRAKENLRTWLNQINQHRMPQNNWLWFRIFVNLALVKSLGIPRDKLQPQITADLNTLDTFEIGEGWSSDGLWGDESKQADYYSGSFAIQFAQLLYVRFAGDEDVVRAEKYRQSAKDFASVFWRYFDPKGAAIPFGRSMTYRFAFAAFWSAAVCADVKLPEPVSNIGTVKGLILRQLRWWARYLDIFNVDGTLNIGFTYPNMYLSENYNSPQSVYWCLKTFTILMLPEAHSFWNKPELPHPSAPESGPALPKVQVVWPPRHILCNSPEHHFLLSSGQMTKKGHKAREAKYGKFAYSSAFGFSVSCGPLLEQMAPDSTISVSHDGGDTWRVRSEPYQEKIVNVRVLSQDTHIVPGLSSIWRPWKYLDLTITTILIPLVEIFPGWHVRDHRVTCSNPQILSLVADDLQIVDAGFAIDAETPPGTFIPAVHSSTEEIEGYCADDQGFLIRSRAGASGIVDLTQQTEFALDAGEARLSSRTSFLRADPNTNLIASRTFIPIVRHTIPCNKSEGKVDGMEHNNMKFSFVTGVFAVSANAGLTPATVRDMWLNRPRLVIESAGDDLEIHVK